MKQLANRSSTKATRRLGLALVDDRDLGRVAAGAATDSQTTNALVAKIISIINSF